MIVCSKEVIEINISFVSFMFSGPLVVLTCLLHAEIDLICKCKLHNLNYQETAEYFANFYSYPSFFNFVLCGFISIPGDNF